MHRVRLRRGVQAFVASTLAVSAVVTGAEVSNAEEPAPATTNAQPAPPRPDVVHPSASALLPELPETTEETRDVESRPARSGSRPSLGLRPHEIARAVGAPERDVAKHWPVIDEALREKGMTDVRSRIAAVATIVTEVGTGFRPVKEYGGPGYFTQMYEGRSDLGNVRRGDGARYHGRGYIQLTGRANYRHYGERLDVPLEERPGIALRPAVGARVLAEYFAQRGVDSAARRGQWRDVRLKVNGGLNGWTRYRSIVSSLLRTARR